MLTKGEKWTFDDEIDERLTNKLRQKFRDLRDHPRFGFRQFLDHNSTLFSKYGDVLWHEHSVNTQIARNALGEVCYTRGKGTYSAFFNIVAFQGNPWTLDAHQLFLARKFGMIHLPLLDQDELDDKIKGDAAAKGIALVQVLWLIAQLIIRKSRDLPSSQLEITTLAFSVCSCITYVLLWSKPQGVNTPIYIRAKRFASPEELARLAEEGPIPMTTFQRRFAWMSNDFLHHDSRRPKTFTLAFTGLGFGSLIFGGLHTLAWNLQFPTPVEQTLWRIGSVLTFGIPITVYVLSVSAYQLERTLRKERFHRALELMVGTISISSSVPYILARLFMTVEAFRALYFLGPGVFLSTWASNAPHIG